MYCKNCGSAMNENQVVCLHCGVAAGTGNSFCPHCGNAVHEEAVVCLNCGNFLKTANTKSNANTMGMKARPIVKAIILSLITCGIYSIFWFISLTDEMNRASGRVTDTSGGKAFLLSLITCGIYSYFWAYQMGEKRDIVANENGSSNILYLVLSLFGLGIVVYGLLQDTLNKAVEDN